MRPAQRVDGPPPNSSPTGVGEERVDPSFEPSHSDQRLDTTRRFALQRRGGGMRHRLPLAQQGWLRG